ncbi:hypothetical protein BO78DRAFT_426101 [Aspergillus sclerotiicarbonarius CBS 121057]|uniref:Uncharacterized protein n=1 Tax=Aspergillus sclerotiicarbonarius (strain CBS 121057 / IBT 28362) TaxID=1448318 RepID=A0A319F5J9_ASPSB|nr:hypothetical protein BO78DRAFT_426101 [Aspergillus sclerotiicarbonarius CBS 121057]
MCIIEEYTDVYPADVRQRRVLLRCVLGRSVGYCYRTRVVNLGERFHDRPARHFQYAQPRPAEMNSLRHRIVDPREPARSPSYPRRRPARRSSSFRILFPFLRRSPGSDEESDEPSPRGRARSRPYASTPDIPIPPIQREPRATPRPQIRVVSPRVRTPTREKPLPRPAMPYSHEKPLPRPPSTPYPVVIHQEPARPPRPARYGPRPPPPPPPAGMPSATPIHPPSTPPVKKVRLPRERSPVTEREPIRKPSSIPTPVQIHTPPTPRPEYRPEPRHVRFSDTVDHVSLSSDGAPSPVFPPRYYSRFSSSAIHGDHSPSSYGHRRPSSPFPVSKEAARRYTYPDRPHRNPAAPPPGRYRQHAPAPLRGYAGGYPAQVRTPARIIEEGRPLYERARAFEEAQRRRGVPVEGRWRPRMRGSDRYGEIRLGDERIARDQGHPSRRWRWL